MRRPTAVPTTPLIPKEAVQISEIVLGLVKSDTLPPILSRQRGGFAEILRVAMSVASPTVKKPGDPQGLREEILRQAQGIEGDNTLHERRIDPAALTAMRDALGKIHAIFGNNGTGVDHPTVADDATLTDAPTLLGNGPLNGGTVFSLSTVGEKHGVRPEPRPSRSAAERLKGLLEHGDEDERTLTDEQVALARELGLEVTGDRRMERAWGQLMAFAETDMIMLVRGQPGTGKEPFAQAVHGIRQKNGLTKKPEVITLNAAAINDGISESEFFGHKKGAFTGANENHTGKFELAHEGTLFLDEIGDMPMGQQAKLLRVLENGVVTPAGSNTSVAVQVKVVCATNRPLEELVKEGKFRADLLSRLKGCQIALPSWGDRTARHKRMVIDFLTANLRHKDAQKREIRFDDAALLLLLETKFAGNVREIRDLLKRAHVFASLGKKGDSAIRIEAAHVHQALEQDVVDVGGSSMRSYGSDVEFAQLEQDGDGHRLQFAVRLPLKGHMDEVKQAVAEVLAWEICHRLEGGHIGNTGKRLGVSRRTITNYAAAYRSKTGMPDRAEDAPETNE